MKLLVTADDFGLTGSGTDTILQCVDKGLLNSVSLVPNGAAFEYAMAGLKARGGVSVGIHINLVEGQPVSPRESVPLLINEAGCFRYGFVGLWRALSLGPKKSGRALLGQVRREIQAQLEKCHRAGQDRFFFRLDSHMHVHMIPPVFHLLPEFIDYYQIRYVRIPRERLIKTGPGIALAARVVSLNGIKLLLLSLLARSARCQLDLLEIPSCRQFLGILYSGKMHRMDLSVILDQFSGEPGVVEVLFHPGGATPAELAAGEVRFADFYLSAARSEEARALRKLRGYLQRYGLQPDDFIPDTTRA